MSRTISLIEQFVAEGSKGEVALQNLRAEVTTRPNVTWTPEMFDRKVAQIKASAKVSKPTTQQVAQAKAKLASPASKAPKAPRWTKQVERYERAYVLPVTIEGPHANGQATINLDRTQISTRSDGKQFQGSLGFVQVGALQFPVRISTQALERLTAKGKITVFLGERAHRVSVR